MKCKRGGRGEGMVEQSESRCEREGTVGGGGGT